MMAVSARRSSPLESNVRMSTLLITHPCFVNHDNGPGHPERPDRMRAIDKALSHDAFAGLTRFEHGV